MVMTLDIVVIQDMEYVLHKEGDGEKLRKVADLQAGIHSGIRPTVPLLLVKMQELSLKECPPLEKALNTRRLFGSVQSSPPSHTTFRKTRTAVRLPFQPQIELRLKNDEDWKAMTIKYLTDPGFYAGIKSLKLENNTRLECALSFVEKRALLNRNSISQCAAQLDQDKAFFSKLHTKETSSTQRMWLRCAKMVHRVVKMSQTRNQKKATREFLGMLRLRDHCNIVTSLLFEVLVDTKARSHGALKERYLSDESEARWAERKDKKRSSLSTKAQDQQLHSQSTVGALEDVPHGHGELNVETKRSTGKRRRRGKSTSASANSRRRSGFGMNGAEVGTEGAVNGEVGSSDDEQYSSIAQAEVPSHSTELQGEEEDQQGASIENVPSEIASEDWEAAVLGDTEGFDFPTETGSSATPPQLLLIQRAAQVPAMSSQTMPAGGGTGPGTAEQSFTTHRQRIYIESLEFQKLQAQGEYQQLEEKVQRLLKAHSRSSKRIREETKDYNELKKDYERLADKRRDAMTKHREEKIELRQKITALKAGNQEPEGQRDSAR